MESTLVIMTTFSFVQFNTCGKIKTANKYPQFPALYLRSLQTNQSHSKNEKKFSFSSYKLCKRNLNKSPKERIIVVLQHGGSYYLEEKRPSVCGFLWGFRDIECPHKNDNRRGDVCTKDIDEPQIEPYIGKILPWRWIRLQLGDKGHYESNYILDSAAFSSFQSKHLNTISAAGISRSHCTMHIRKRDANIEYMGRLRCQID